MPRPIVFRSMWTLSPLLFIVLAATLVSYAFRAQSHSDYDRLAHRPGVTDYQRYVYARLSKLVSDSKSRPSPEGLLPAFHDLDALPPLVDALADDRIVALDRRRPNHVLPVRMCVLAAGGIQHTAQHAFAVGDGSKYTLSSSAHVFQDHPELVIRSQNLILDWYRQNRPKFLRRRKLDDLTDPFFQNRIMAFQWLGTHKDRDATEPILSRANAILRQKAIRWDTLICYELSECALALGRIGDRRSLSCVRSISDVIADEISRSYLVRKEHTMDRLHLPGCAQVEDLFRSYHGLALIGKESDAICQIKSLCETFTKGMTWGQRRSFDRGLAQLKEW